MSINIDVYSTALSFQEEEVRNKTVVIVDVLRASSVIITALHHQAKGVIPVSDIGEGGRIAQNLDPSTYLLCGERDAHKIEGYHLGNSPFEYQSSSIKDKTLIYTTTNGTKAITRCESAKEVIIAGFLNLSAVVRHLKQKQEEIILICSGWKNRTSLEDTLCAGSILYHYYDGTLPDNSKDGAKLAFVVYERFKNQLTEVISQTNHASRLIGIGAQDDIAYCCALDTIPLVPVIKDGIIKKADG